MRYIGLGIGSLLLVLAPAGCGDDGDVVCGEGTVLSMSGECVAECGPNTVAIDGACQVAPTACGGGAVLNETNSTCEFDDAPGELIAQGSTAQGTAYNTFHLLGYMDGDTPTPLAPDLYLDPEVPDDTVVVMLSGRPANEGKLPVSSFNLSEQEATTLHNGGTGSGETQFTVGDFKKCNHDLKVFRLDNGLYRMRYTISSCLPNMLYTAWISYTPEAPEDPTDVDQFRASQKKFNMITAAGGLPHSLTTNPDGYGVKEVDLDPTFWFKAGEVCGGGFSCVPVPPFGPPSQDTIQLDGSIFFEVQLHTTGQNNGNPGSCYMRDDGSCIEDPAEVDLAPPYNQHIFWIGREGDDAAHMSSVFLPISELQP